MATLSDLYTNLKTLLNKTYLEKKSNNYHQNGIVTTNNNREITTTQSLSYDSLSNKPTIPAAAANGTFSVKTKVGSNNAVTAADFTAN